MGKELEKENHSCPTARMGGVTPSRGHCRQVSPAQSHLGLREMGKRMWDGVGSGEKGREDEGKTRSIKLGALEVEKKMKVYSAPIYKLNS